MIVVLFVSFIMLLCRTYHLYVYIGLKCIGRT